MDTARDSSRFAALGQELGRAIGVPWVRYGLLASILIVLGSLTPAYLPQNSPWWGPVRALRMDGMVGKVGGTVLILLGLGLLTQAWLSLRPLVNSGVRHWAVGAWWSLPLLLAPPLFSHDAYSYAAQGWLVHNGINPYENGPNVLPGAFADQSPWVWRFTPTPYGPLSLQIQHAILHLASFNPYWSAVAMRIPALVGVALIVILIPRIARRMGVDEAYAAWFACLNPILLMDFVGGAHNDAFMTGLVVLAVWLAFRDWWLLGAVMVGVAATIKQPAFLAAWALGFVPLLASPERQGRRPLLRGFLRAGIASVVAIASFVFISYLTGFDFGWLNAIGVPGSVLTISPSTTIGLLLGVVASLVGHPELQPLLIRRTRTVFMAATVAYVGWLALFRFPRRPIRALALAFLAVAFGSPALHGWYVLWGGVLIPLAEPGRRTDRAATWVSVGLLSYAAINLAWRNGNTALGIAAIAPLAWQVIAHHRATPEALA